MIPKRLEECSKLIDGIDVRILELLNERTRVVEEIGRIKQELGLPIYEPRREDDVYRNIVEHNQGPLTADGLKRIFERIIDEMRSLQKMRRELQEHGDKGPRGPV